MRWERGGISLLAAAPSRKRSIMIKITEEAAQKAMENMLKDIQENKTFGSTSDKIMCQIPHYKSLVVAHILAIMEMLPLIELESLVRRLLSCGVDIGLQIAYEIQENGQKLERMEAEEQKAKILNFPKTPTDSIN